MGRPRRSYQPVAVEGLEGRELLTTIPAILDPFTKLVQYGVQTQPIVTVVKAGSRNPVVLNETQLFFWTNYSVKVINPISPQAVAAAKANPNLVTYEIKIHNTSGKRYTSAIVIDNLARHLAYVPGDDHAPKVSQFSVTKSDKGVQSLIWTFPQGIPAGGTVTLTFQAEVQQLG